MTNSSSTASPANDQLLASSPKPSAKHVQDAELQQEARALNGDIALTVLCGIGLVLGMSIGLGLWPLDEAWRIAAYTLAYLSGGTIAARNAWASLRQKKLDIDFLMLSAALAAAAVGEVRDGAILLLLFSLANTLEHYAMGRTKRAVRGLMALYPDTAQRVCDAQGNTEEVSIESIEPGDVVIVRPGERIPVDGKVLRGQSAVDASAITGESMPQDVSPGEAVFAASINKHGVLEIKVSKRAQESTLARMIALVSEAQAQRSPAERFSDWFGQRYTYGVLAGSALSLGLFVWFGVPQEQALYRAATLLVVASPCAIVISVPAAVLSALASAARNGVLFKGGAALEQLAQGSIIAFDKTGTLTRGEPVVSDCIAWQSSTTELLQVVASLEQHSEHPIAQSVLAYSRAQGVQVSRAENSEAISGQGIVGTIQGQRYWAGNRRLAAAQQLQLDPALEQDLQALEQQGKSCLIVGNETQILGVLAIADQVRSSARATIQALRQAGFGRIVMLTGDHPAAAQHIAGQLGLAPEDVYASLLPEDKVQQVKALREQGVTVFVGDGINDAAALATADISIAMGAAGSDAAIEAADVALLSDDLGKLVQAHTLSQRANHIIRQNLGFAIGVMLLMVAITFSGNLPLPLGVLGHEGGTILVVLNGLRLLR